MTPIHHSILCQTQDDYNAALAILRTPIITAGPKRGILRRPRDQIIILAWCVGHYIGYGEYEKRCALCFTEITETDGEVWQRIATALEPLKLESTDDSEEAWRFLGRI